MQQTSVQKQNKTNNNLGGFQMKEFIKNLLNKRLNNEKGLTLIELLAVIVILAIIAAIAVPAIGNIINNSRDKAIMSEALNIISGAKMADMNGDCDAEAETSTCVNTNTKMADYVEGLPEKLANGSTDLAYSVSYDDDNGWSITYNRFGDLNAETLEGLNGTTISETNLKGNLD